jgi:hypothetical protein
MAKTKQTKTVKVDVAPTPSKTQTESVGQDWIPGQESKSSYVVTRDGFRVSDNEYISPDWPQAIQERDFWQKVSNRSKDGTHVEIVEYDKKKHRVY